MSRRFFTLGDSAARGAALNETPFNFRLQPDLLLESSLESLRVKLAIMQVLIIEDERKLAEAIGAG